MRPWAPALLLLVAAVGLGHALERPEGATALLLLALVAAALAAWRPAEGDARSEAGARTVLALGVALQCVLWLSQPPSFGAPLTPDDFAHLVYAVELLVLAGLAAVLVRGEWGWAAFVVAAGAVVMVGAWTVARSPTPDIDVHVWQLEGMRALLEGRSPYALTIPNIYGDTRFYCEGCVVNGRVQFGYPYPPLALAVGLVGELLAGDYRYALLACDALAALCVAVAVGGRLGRGAALLFLTTPRLLFTVERGFTEPVVALGLGLTVLCAARWRRGLPVAFGLLLASKQYAPLLLPLAVLLVPRGTPRREWVRLGAVALGTALAVTLPLALMDVRAFLHSALAFHLRQPYRQDSLSLPAALVRTFGGAPRLWLGALALPAAYALALWRRPERSAGAFVAASALVLLTFFAFGKQAFTNYYVLVVLFLASAGALLARPARA